jgi:hypothetical protein
MLRTLLLSVALLAGLTTAALADAVDEFVYWRTALAIDDMCHVLKYVERTQVETLAAEALELTTQRAHFLDGRVAEDDYSSWLEQTMGSAAAAAQQVGCTSAAEPNLLQARDAASQLIYRGLLTAFHFAGLPENDIYRLPLTPDAVEAANRYDAFLQQVYQQNFQPFAEAQKQAAAAKLPPATPTYDVGFSLGTYGLLDEADSKRVWDAQASASNIIDLVQFEVAAEIKGWRVFSSGNGNGRYHAVLVRADGSLTQQVVWYGPFKLSTAEGLSVPIVAVAMTDGSLRIMTYGAQVSEELAGARATLFVRTGAAPQGLSSYDLLADPAWPQIVTAFEGTRVGDTCLGGPCFSFPPEAAAAILAGTDADNAELFLAAKADATPDFTKPIYDRARIGNVGLFRINGR